MLALAVLNHTDTPKVTTTSDHSELSGLELEVLGDLARSDINLDCVVSLDMRIRVADGAGVVGDNNWDTTLTDEGLGDLAELELGLAVLNLVNGVATLDVVQEAEVLTGLGDGDNIHESSRVVHVGADLAVNLNVAFLHDHLDLVVGEGIFEAVSEENNEWEALAKLVWAGGWAGSIATGKLVKHPVLGSGQPLQVTLGTSCHGCR